MAHNVSVTELTWPFRCCCTVRVAVVAESFLPHVNGVTNSVLRVLEHFDRRGIQASVIAPGHSRDGAPSRHLSSSIIRIPSLPMPGYPQVRVSLARYRTMKDILGSLECDVVHLASPFLTGLPAVRASRELGVPSVAVFQTDVARYARCYGLAAASRLAWSLLSTIHREADLTLAPSSAAIGELQAHGIERVALWRRGVDSQRFSPDRRDEGWRRSLAPRGQALVGFMGRLAPEKCIEDLRVLVADPHIQLVIIGDGPRRRSLERILPGAVFTGFLDGGELPKALASLDIMVNTGPAETFCQSVQEAMACAVPVVAAAAGGPLDLVSPSRTGWLYPVGDLEAMSGYVRDLAGDRAKARAMGLAARESVLERSWYSVCEELFGHYSSLMPRGGQTHRSWAA